MSLTKDDVAIVECIRCGTPHSGVLPVECSGCGFSFVAMKKDKAPQTPKPTPPRPSSPDPRPGGPAKPQV